MQATTFNKLNHEWNADPNVPEPVVELKGRQLELRFFLNSHQFPRFTEGQVGVLVFDEVARYRLGATNDEGWYRGQCRFSDIAPGWGEFYEVGGNLRLQLVREAWNELPESKGRGRRHYLFYFRDETFECDADGWHFSVMERRSETA
jgi:hypothetical protein